MSEIRTKPASKKYRENFDRVFGKKTKWGVPIEVFEKNRKKREEGMQRFLSEIIEEVDRNRIIANGGKSNDEYIDWGEFKTHICVNADPNFGG